MNNVEPAKMISFGTKMQLSSGATSLLRYMVFEEDIYDGKQLSNGTEAETQGSLM